MLLKTARKPWFPTHVAVKSTQHGSKDFQDKRTSDLIFENSTKNQRSSFERAEVGVSKNVRNKMAGKRVVQFAKIENFLFAKVE